MNFFERNNIRYCVSQKIRHEDILTISKKTDINWLMQKYLNRVKKLPKNIF
jgi:hypothetical protein